MTSDSARNNLDFLKFGAKTNLVELRLVVGAIPDGSGEVLLLQVNLPDVPLLVLHAVLVHGVLRKNVDLQRMSIQKLYYDFKIIFSNSYLNALRQKN